MKKLLLTTSFSSLLNVAQASMAPYSFVRQLVRRLALLLILSISTHVYADGDKRPLMRERCFTSHAVEQLIAQVAESIKDTKLRNMFINCYPNTLDTTVKQGVRKGKEDTFVITGDIDAMWLRDSSAQLFPYLSLMKDDPALQQLVAGAIRRQVACILIDPYANAFNFSATGSEWKSDLTNMLPELHERKWEIDSLCYAIRLAYSYWLLTGDTSVFDDDWQKAMHLIVKTFKEQQRKENRGPYKFQRKTYVPTDTQQGYGWGAPVNPCGMIFSAFRPSDDATQYGFLIPSNMFAVVSLRQLAEMSERIIRDETFANKCRELADEVDEAINKYAIVNHPKYGRIYAYEVDGFGNYLMMDDANIPSLLSIPYIGYCKADDEVYMNTRRFVWSADNPYFFRGKDGEGIGGPHVGVDYAWPMSIIIKGLTSNDVDELYECLYQLRNTDGDTGFMHESFDVNDHRHFTRKWFAWANNLFGELVNTVYRTHPDILAEDFSASKKVTMNYGTFNIRYDNKDDAKKGRGWEVRRDTLARYILNKDIDIVGMQEVLNNQLKDLQARLPGYGYVGVGRDDGKTRGEYAAIFYKKEKFDVLDSGTFWLSQYPDSAGFVGWDGACCRIATWAKFRDKSSGRIFMSVNTHLDHVGTEARKKGALLIIKKIKDIVGDSPAILTGDFNVDDTSEAYRTITTNEFILRDAYKISESVRGANYTYHDWAKLPLRGSNGIKRSKIDFIFVTKQIDVLKTEIPELRPEGLPVPFMSDHNPIISVIRL